MHKVYVRRMILYAFHPMQVLGLHIGICQKPGAAATYYYLRALAAPGIRYFFLLPDIFNAGEPDGLPGRFFCW